MVVGLLPSFLPWAFACCKELFTLALSIDTSSSQHTAEICRKAFVIASSSPVPAINRNAAQYAQANLLLFHLINDAAQLLGTAGKARYFHRQNCIPWLYKIEKRLQALFDRSLSVLVCRLRTVLQLLSARPVRPEFRL